MTKLFSTLAKYFPPAFLLGCLLSSALAGFVFFYYVNHQDREAVADYPYIEWVEKIHNLTIDYRMVARGPRKGSDDVAILTIDEKAIQKYGRWPWPRSMMAEVIDGIMENGARSIAFDIIFSEKQEALLNSLADIQVDLKRSFPGNTKAIDEVFLKQREKQDHDKKLTEVVEKHSDKLIMGAVYDELAKVPFAAQDTCFLDISKQKGHYDYWDKESNVVSVANPAKIKLPQAWHKVIFNHFDNLESKVLKNWSQANNHHGLLKLFNFLGLSFENPAHLKILATFLRGKKEVYDDKEYETIVPWSSLDKSFPQEERADVRTAMNSELFNYCLRYLRNNDELAPEFEKQWDGITAQYETFKGLSYQQAKDYIQTATLEIPVHQVGNWLFNIPSLADVTEHSGTFNATQDRDGSVRRAKLFVRNGDNFIPSLAFKAYMVINDYYATANLEKNTNDVDGNGLSRSTIMSHVKLVDEDDNPVLQLPTDHFGQLPINYAGPQKMFSYLSAGEILDGGDTLTIEQRVQKENGKWEEETFEVDKKEYLKNKNFVFGATATGIYDLRVTPFEENYPGVETHANMLDNLLRQDYLKTNPEEAFYMPLFVLLLGVAFSFVVSYYGAVSGLLIALLTLSSIWIFDRFFIFSKGTVIVVIFPILTISFLYTLLTFFKYFTEERKKAQLKGTFQKYVSPEIVEEILKDPSKLELGGMKMEMSVFFSDIRGFTTISEKLDPKALSDLLNHYLTPMTDIIFKNSGTLDKYMGDAIMAFFGAPVPSKDHAAQACRASLIQIEKLFELQKIYEEQGLPMIDIGIGVNTGDMSVGNMGSETVRNYTVMGDSVNLGARLEGINKQYGTRIIISEFTKAKISADEFLYREIDWVKVKGKNEPVKIYELMEMDEFPQWQKDQVLNFNSGFGFYHEQQWEKAIEEFNKALTINAEDFTSKLYIKRCQDYLVTAPGKDWDGVFTMTTK